jgi:hypothetical protein
MMATSAAAIRDGFRHPRIALQRWVARSSRSTDDARSNDAMATATHDANSPERLERIAAYARSGYFHMEYTAGMFVVPLDIPPD